MPLIVLKQKLDLIKFLCQWTQVLTAQVFAYSLGTSLAKKCSDQKPTLSPKYQLVSGSKNDDLAPIVHERVSWAAFKRQSSVNVLSKKNRNISLPGTNSSRNGVQVDHRLGSSSWVHIEFVIHSLPPFSWMALLHPVRSRSKCITSKLFHIKQAINFSGWTISLCLKFKKRPIICKPMST